MANIKKYDDAASCHKDECQMFFDQWKTCWNKFVEWQGENFKGLGKYSFDLKTFYPHLMCITIISTNTINLSSFLNSDES